MNLLKSNKKSILLKTFLFGQSLLNAFDIINMPRVPNIFTEVYWSIMPKTPWQFKDFYPTKIPTNNKRIEIYEEEKNLLVMKQCPSKNYLKNKERKTL